MTPSERLSTVLLTLCLTLALALAPLACGDDDDDGGGGGTPGPDLGASLDASAGDDLGRAADLAPPPDQGSAGEEDAAAVDAGAVDTGLPPRDAAGAADAAVDTGAEADLGPAGDCPQGESCHAGYCVPDDRADEQCVTDEHCRQQDPDAPTTCNVGAAGGICLGCGEDGHCPAGTECSDFGSCNGSCDDDADCPYGPCNAGLGLCTQQTCADDNDCPGSTVCQDPDGDGRGLCGRRACEERWCSPTNLDGPCEEPAAACLYGACVASCDPNPCEVEPHRTRCELVDGRPSCACAEGYAPDEGGVCRPEAVPDCPHGFVCQAGYCVDRAAAGFQCALDEDCADLTCGAPITLPSGKCVGCDGPQDCPRADACLAGYCLQTCAGAADCHAGMGCVNGYCGGLPCAAPADCPAGYTCGASAKCERRPCGQ